MYSPLVVSARRRRAPSDPPPMNPRTHARALLRRFVAASYAGFWQRYLKIAAADRHFYEVIPEGSPCKLYFDLEFPRAANPQHGAFAPGNAAADTDANTASHGSSGYS